MGDKLSSPTPVARKSDLKVRTLSALVMMLLAGGALWLGGYVWSGFVVLVAAGVLWEWVRLVHAITPRPIGRGLWNAGGIVYILIAATMLDVLRSAPQGALSVLTVLGLVIATDVGAYFTGRTFGGPKIAPSISPSKTWSGLLGGMAMAALVMMLRVWTGPGPMQTGLLVPALFGAVGAIIAQTGDFFESGMKRRAGVKDSSDLIPGHGGLFDRVDGLLAVCFALGLYYIFLRSVGQL